MKKIWVFILVFFVPIVSSGQVVITEIMYDLEGSDTGREWVEVFNEGSESVDLSLWKLNEAEINHKLKFFQGNETLVSGGYAIISDNPEKLLIDWPLFSGTIFDSSFSLKNTGELLILKDGDLNEIDQVNYSSEWGAVGDGTSLQKIDGAWVSAVPTLGEVNALSLPNQGGGGETDTQTESSDNEGLAEGIWISDNNTITVFAGEDKQVIAGADTLYEAEALGTKNIPLDNARFLWSFGDGGKKEGKKVLYAHNYPGDYIVVLNVSSGKYTASDRVMIKALPADISISKIEAGVNSFVELYNKSSYELNLSWWRIRSGDQYFTLPKDTILMAGSKVSFPIQATGLNILNKQDVELIYPNGTSVTSYQKESPPPLVVSSNITTKITESPEVRVEQVTQPRPNISETDEISFVDSGESDQIALASATFVDEEKFNLGPSKIGKTTYKWLVGLFFVVFIAILAFILAKKDDIGSEDIEIIE